MKGLPSHALDLGKYGIRVNTVSPTKTIVKNEINKQCKAEIN